MSARIILRKFGKIVATIGVAAFFSIGIGFGIQKFFTIETIEVRGAGIRAVVDQKKISKNLLFFPTELLRNQLLSENPLLIDVVIQKKLPHTLVIVPKLRTSIVRLQTSARSVDVDKEGMVISDSMPGESLPVLMFDISPVKIGQKIADPQVVAGLDAVVHIGTFLPIDKVTAFDSGSLLVISGPLRIYITQHEDISAVSSTLQTLLAGFRIKGTLPAVIDLRFAKPVISF